MLAFCILAWGLAVCIYIFAILYDEQSLVFGCADGFLRIGCLLSRCFALGTVAAGHTWGRNDWATCKKAIDLARHKHLIQHFLLLNASMSASRSDILCTFSGCSETLTHRNKLRLLRLIFGHIGRPVAAAHTFCLLTQNDIIFQMLVVSHLVRKLYCASIVTLLMSRTWRSLIL